MHRVTARTYRKPEIWLDLGKVDVRFLTDGVSRVHHAQNALLFAYADHRLPRHVDRGIADNGVNHADDLRIGIVFSRFGTRQSVQEFLEVFQELCMRLRKGDRELRHSNLWIEIVDVLHGPREVRKSSGRCRQKSGNVLRNTRSIRLPPETIVSPFFQPSPCRMAAAAVVAVEMSTHSSVSAPISFASRLRTDNKSEWYSIVKNLSGLASIWSVSTVQTRCTGVGKEPKAPVERYVSLMNKCRSTRERCRSLTVVQVDEARIEREEFEHRPTEWRWHVPNIIPQINLELRLLERTHSSRRRGVEGGDEGRSEGDRTNGLCETVATRQYPIATPISAHTLDLAQRMANSVRRGTQGLLTSRSQGFCSSELWSRWLRGYRAYGAGCVEWRVGGAGVRRKML